jgi:hypothetical protein
MIPRDIAREYFRTWIETMHKRNFESILGAKRSRMGSNYLEKRKPGGGDRIHRFLGSWIHPRTQRFHKGTMKSPKGGLGAPSRLFMRSEIIGEGLSSV